jgi:hypothetical protein
MAGLLALRVRFQPLQTYTANADSEPSTRDQAFMTGFAHQIFRLQELPRELATWMIDQSKKFVCVERCNC